MAASSESNLPYAATVASLVGLLVLLYGVSIHNYTPQIVGGAAVVVGVLLLSYHVVRLPTPEDAGH